ncbi:MAG: efflux RND transporter permease subunit [Mariprofundaceae bacterium]|nr:efflux RND transporter permease subunit [Mariprofundaceae bacterium]
MNLPELAIKRHVLAWMLSAILILFGVVSYQKIGIDRFPTVEFPMVTVTTVYTGAHPDIIDATVTSVIEEKVNSIPGIKHIMSSSSPGVSNVTIEFNLSKSVDVAFTEVQTKVSRVLRRLPEGVDPPTVAKVEIGASAMMWLSLTGDRTMQQLNQYARNIIKKRLETIDGVGEIRIGGRRARTIRVWLDLERMNGLKVSIPEITQAFSREHVQFPGGFLVDSQQEYLIKLDMEYHHVSDLENMVVRSNEGFNIKLKDVARVEDGLADNRQIAHFNGERSVGIGIVKISGSNTVAISEEVNRRLETDIYPNLPPGVELHISTNNADVIKNIIDELKVHLVLSVLLAALVVLFFLKNLVSTLIISFAMPVSLMAAVAAAYFFGFTLNLMTLLAMLLLVGVVVDDAIVVLENIYRHREQGLEANARDAAMAGSKEVTFAVMAATLTLVAIFAPVVFMDGILGRFFAAFAVLVTVGVLASLLVSLTLTPMLCSRYLNVSTQHGFVYRFFDYLYSLMERSYRVLLQVALRFRWLTLLLAMLVFVGSTSLVDQVGKGFVPPEDENRFMLFFKAPLGASIDQTSARMQDVEKVLAVNPNVRNYFTAIGLGSGGQANRGIGFVKLTPKQDRSIPQWEVMAAVQKELGKIAGVRAFALAVPVVSGGGRGDPLQFSVSSSNLKELAVTAKEIAEKLNAYPDLGRVDMDLQLDLPQLDISINRERAAQLGLSSQDMALAVNVLAGGMNVARYNDEPGDGNRYDIRLQAEQGTLNQPADLKKVYLRSNTGNMVRLDTVATWKTGLGPAVVPRMDLRYSAMFYSTPNVPVGDAVTQVRSVMDENLPLGYQFQLMGEAAEFEQSAKHTMFVLVLAMLLVYMVLASQFNSFLQPMVLMLAQPLAIIGGIAALWMVDETMNIFSMIGFVLLIGLAAKNAILLVDLTNQMRARGHSIYDALSEACPVRLRPVLMTSITIVASLTPTAMAMGSGSEMTKSLAVAVIGGIITSTLLTLLVIPAAYSLLEGGLLRVKAWRK